MAFTGKYLFKFIYKIKINRFFIIIGIFRL